MFKVSQSKIKTYRRCHKQYRYKYIDKIMKKVKSKPLVLGTIVHEALEAFLLGKDIEPVFKAHEKKFNKLFSEEGYEDVIPLSRTMVDMYIHRYKNDKEYNRFKPVHVEAEFSVPLIEGVLFEGKIDGIVEDHKGRHWVLEHKTYAKETSEAQRMSDIQVASYSWAMEQAGMVPPSGVIWDYLRKKAPALPEPLKKGGLSKSQGIDTTYDIYLKAIEDNGLDPKDYEEVLERLKAQKDKFQYRITLPFSQKATDIIVTDLKSTATEIKHLGHILQDRNLTKDCSWCDYFSLCQGEMRGHDTDFIIKQQYTERKKDA